MPSNNKRKASAIASCVLNYVNGDIYTGGLKNDEPHGHGIMKYANGKVLECEWKEGNPTGKAVLKYDNGDVYEGDYKKS
eukprot:scaffold231301_cov63-Cyclotella_meneghiniana.AAC.3